ncbi:MAG: C-terminal binding protein [Verrucomicrobiales bacterium]|nr:C-terminal binding protein [Verrucomicrobiales bacterium]
MHQIIITDFLTGPPDTETGILGDIAQITTLGSESESDLAGKIEHADAIVLYHLISLGADTIRSLKNCKLIVRGGVGTDNVDLHAAQAAGIPVANVPDYGTEEVADTALAMALSLARGTHLLNSRLRRAHGDWSHTQAIPVPRLRGRTFGIVGCGRIGTATALRAKAFGFDVVFHDPYLPDGTEKAIGVRRTNTLDELLHQSHILSLHCPLSPETHHLINSKTLASLPRGAILINTARGAIVDTSAIPPLLESNHLAGAGIDVLEKEPPPPGHPLVTAWRNPAHPAHDRLILNPHAAFYSDQGLDEIRTKSAHNIRQTLLGNAPRNLVT